MYDADPAFADEQNFKILWTDAKKASRKAVSVESHVASGKPAAGTVRTTGYASGAAASFHADLDDDDSIALDMEEAIDDAIMFHGGNSFDWDTRGDYLDDPFGFGDDGMVGMEMSGERRETFRGILRSQIITVIIHSLFFKIFPQMQRVWYNRI